MSAIHCQYCETKQPPYWQGGDLCAGCGRLPRDEFHCGWCAELVPAGKFCRECGFKHVAPEEYPLARILKQEGVDKFSLHKILGEMDPDYRDYLHQRYNQQLAVMEKHIQALLTAQTYLQHKHYVGELAHSLIMALPLSNEDLATYDICYPKADNDQEFLWGVVQQSPIDWVAYLCLLAWVRTLETPLQWQQAQHIVTSFTGRSGMLAYEALALLGDWRFPLIPDLYYWLEALLGEQSGQFGDNLWIALAALRYEVAVDPEMSQRYRSQADRALHATDPHLRLSAAAVLENDAVLVSFLQHKDNPELLNQLANRGSPQLLNLLQEKPIRIKQLKFGVKRVSMPAPIKRLLLEHWLSNHDVEMVDSVAKAFICQSQWLDAEFADDLVTCVMAKFPANVIEQARTLGRLLTLGGAREDKWGSVLARIIDRHPQLVPGILTYLIESGYPHSGATPIRLALFDTDAVVPGLVPVFLQLHPELDTVSVDIALGCPPDSPYVADVSARLKRYIQRVYTKDTPFFQYQKWVNFYLAVIDKNETFTSYPVYRDIVDMVTQTTNPALASWAFFRLLSKGARSLTPDNVSPYRFSEGGEGHVFSLQNTRWVTDFFGSAEILLQRICCWLADEEYFRHVEWLEQEIERHPLAWAAVIAQAPSQAEPLLEHMIAFSARYRTPPEYFFISAAVLKPLILHLKDYANWAKRITVIHWPEFWSEYLLTWWTQDQETCLQFIRKQLPIIEDKGLRKQFEQFLENHETTAP